MSKGDGLWGVSEAPRAATSKEQLAAEKIILTAETIRRQRCHFLPRTPKEMEFIIAKLAEFNILNYAGTMAKLRGDQKRALSEGFYLGSTYSLYVGTHASSHANIPSLNADNFPGVREIDYLAPRDFLKRAVHDANITFQPHSVQDAKDLIKVLSRYGIAPDNRLSLQSAVTKGMRVENGKLVLGAIGDPPPIPPCGACAQHAEEKRKEAERLAEEAVSKIRLRGKDLRLTEETARVFDRFFASYEQEVERRIEAEKKLDRLLSILDRQEPNLSRALDKKRTGEFKP